MTRPVFDHIRAGLEEAMAHARGEDVPGLIVHEFPAGARLPPPIDVAEIRGRTGLSQKRFALSIGVPLGTLRHWEQGRRQPQGAARVLLALLGRDPNLVRHTLGGVSA